VPTAFDHVVVAIDTLERGLAALEPTMGSAVHQRLRYLSSGYGAEPGRGVKSAIFPLDHGAYLELIAPDYEDPSATAVGPAYARYREPTPVGWFIRVSSADSVQSQLTKSQLRPLPTIVGAAVAEPNDTIRWRSVHFAHLTTTLAPVFVAWPSVAHLGLSLPTSSCTLQAFELRYRKPEVLDSTFRSAGVPVSIKLASGPTTGIYVALRCSGGTLVLPHGR
jgi:hypothetical protein